MDEDHHVAEFTAEISDVAVAGLRLRWTAKGDLADKNADDAFEFCYRYTALMWNSSQIDAVIDYDSRQRGLQDPADAALIEQPVSLTNRIIATSRRFAILPRGFRVGYLWGSDVFPIACFNCRPNHHLLQAGFHMDSTDVTIDNPTLSWQGYGIFRDN